MPWVLPSRGRQKLCQQTLDACRDTGMSTPGYLFIDARVDPYEGLEAGSNWRVIRVDFEHYNWDLINLVYKIEPQAEWYGVMSDDVVPITPGWDKYMIQAAKPFYLVDCHDGWLANDPLIALYSLCGNVFVWGGELIRAVGWWGVPGIRSGVGQDDAWVHLLCKKLSALHLRRLLMTVLVEHHQYKNNKREKDENDLFIRSDVNYLQRDWTLFEAWRANDAEVNKTADRVNAMVQSYRKHEMHSFTLDGKMFQGHLQRM